MRKAMVEMENQTEPEQPPRTILTSKKKRNLPGMPDPDAEVIALSPTALLATNRFVCEICNKGFQRDQNLQLHRRGHNLPWKLKQRSNKDAVKKRVYVCPEPTCVHHDPSRALGDLTGIKKHFSRKHGEKKYKCGRCSKKYAVQSDWKAHVKTCGTREYPCDCGTLFSRRDSFITHRAFCDALAQESARTQPQSGATGDGGDLTAQIVAPPPPTAAAAVSPPPPPHTPSTSVLTPVMSIQSSELPENQSAHLQPPPPPPPQGPTALTTPIASTITVTTTTSSSTTSGTDESALAAKLNPSTSELSQSSHRQLAAAPYSNLLYPLSVSAHAAIDPMSLSLSSSSSFYGPPSPLFPVTSSSQNSHQPLYLSRPQPALSATALLQKAAQMGSTSSNPSFLRGLGLTLPSSSSPQNNNTLTNWNDNSVMIESNSLMASGLGIGLPSGGSSDFNELMMGSSGIFSGRPATLDFLGLGMRGGEPSSEGLSVFFSSISGDDDSACGMWDGSCDRKPSVL